jgi:hypothetical protein
MHVWVEQNSASPSWVVEPTVSVGGPTGAPPLDGVLEDVEGVVTGAGFGAGLGFGFGRALGFGFGRCFAGAVVVLCVAAAVDVALEDVEPPPQPASPRRRPMRAMVAACRQRDIDANPNRVRPARLLDLE